MKPLKFAKTRLFFVCMLFNLPAFAQVSWEALPFKFDHEFDSIIGFYIDSEDSTLLCLGQLRSVNGIQIQSIVGIRKDQTLKYYPPLPTANMSGACALRWNGELYVGGSGGFIKWTNNAWQLLDSGSVVQCLYPYQGKLLVGGRFEYGIGNIASAAYLVEYDGANFAKFKGVDTVIGPSAGGVYAITEYQNELYVAGNFTNVPPKDIRWKEIVRWTGANWREVGNGIPGVGFEEVGDLQVFNNELYVGGIFKESTGGPGNNIAKWDGASWGKLGVGVHPQGAVYKIDTLGDTLLVGGAFITAGNQPAYSYAAYYNGKWCSNTDTIINNPFVTGLINYFGDIVVGGGFVMIGQDSFYRIAKVVSHGDCLKSASVEDIDQFSVKIFPNPVDAIVSVQFPNHNQRTSFQLYDMEGRLLYNDWTNQQSLAISLQNYSTGIYLLRITQGSSTVIQKIQKN